jgi:Dehydratase family
MPCNFNLRRLAAKVKEGIRAAGGTPIEFDTVAITDVVTMGTEGLKAALVSREVIAAAACRSPDDVWIGNEIMVPEGKPPLPASRSRRAGCAGGERGQGLRPGASASDAHADVHDAAGRSDVLECSPHRDSVHLAPGCQIGYGLKPHSWDCSPGRMSSTRPVASLLPPALCVSRARIVRMCPAVDLHQQHTRQRLWHAWELCQRHASGFITVDAACRHGRMHGPALLYADLMTRAQQAFRWRGPLWGVAHGFITVDAGAPRPAPGLLLATARTHHVERAPGRTPSCRASQTSRAALALARRTADHLGPLPPG